MNASAMLVDLARKRSVKDRSGDVNELLNRLVDLHQNGAPLTSIYATATLMNCDTREFYMNARRRFKEPGVKKFQEFMTQALMGDADEAAFDEFRVGVAGLIKSAIGEAGVDLGATVEGMEPFFIRLEILGEWPPQMPEEVPTT